MILENQHILMTIDDISGAVCSFVMKKHGTDMLGEKRLRKNFSLRLRCGGAIDGMDYRVSSARQEGNRAFFCYQVGEISLACTITLDGEKVFFESRMENGGDDVVEELRYPQLGGITNWAGGVSAKMTYAGYLNLPDPVPLFRKFPTAGAGGEPACFALTYPGMMMPWQDIYDEETNTGLYLGYHDETYRYSAWEYVLHPTTSGNAEDSWIRGEEAGGEPSGMVFSHVRCPFLGKGRKLLQRKVCAHGP